MYCFNFFRNQLLQHLISYNSFRNMNMCFLEVAMSEKCRSSHFQSEGGVKSLRTWGVKKFQDWGVIDLQGVTFAGGGGSVPHYKQCIKLHQKLTDRRSAGTLVQMPTKAGREILHILRRIHNPVVNVFQLQSTLLNTKWKLGYTTQWNIASKHLPTQTI